MSFETKIVVSNDVLIISLKGKILDDTQLDELLGTVEDQLTAVGGKAVFDLSELDYINSSGINFCIRLLTKARVHGGDLVLCGIHGKVKTIVEIAKMDEVFKTTDSLDEAIQFFKTTK